MSIGKFFRWIALSILGIVGLVVLASVAVVVLGVTINLDAIRPVVETSASEMLGRPVKIAGAVTLKPTLRPTVEINDVSIGNPSGWTDPEFIKADLARVQVGLRDLLKKEIYVGEITAEGVVFNLETNKKGDNNWQLTAQDKETSQTETTPRKEPDPKTAPKDQPQAEEKVPESDGKVIFKALDKLSMKQIEVTYRDAVMGKVVKFHMDDLSGEAKAGKPVTMTARGKLQDHAYNFSIEGGSIEDLLAKKDLWPLSISGKVAGTPIDARGKFGEVDQEPVLHIGFSLGKIDIGRLLERLNLVKDIEASTEKFAVDAILRGDSLNEIVKQSEFSVALEGGQWTLRGATAQGSLPITNLKGEIASKPGKAVLWTLNGTIDATPVDISIKGMPLAEYVNNPDRLTIAIRASAAGAQLDFSGGLKMPIDAKTVNLDMAFQGEKLNSLNELLRVDLPPIGPYSLKAKFAVEGGGYELSDMNLKVGTSELLGKMSLKTGGAKPKAEVHLTAKRLQIDDFATIDWSPEKKNPSEKPTAPPEEATKDAKDGQTAENRQKVAALLSPEAMGRLDATLSIEVAQVLLGQETLGGGVLNVSLLDGRFSVAPLKLDIPGGSVQADFSFHPKGTQTEIHIGADIDKFDYGVLARRIDPKTKTEGKVSLKVLLDGSAPDLKQLMATSNGQFDFALVPGDNFDAGIFDLWAVNLITSLSKEMDDEPQSTVNCVVARFGLDDGLMKEKAIFMDTTRMSINAEATINFKTRTIALKAAPKAKRPEFFSLATPVKVTGSFSDFGIGINKLSLAKTATSFVVSPLAVPIKRLFKGEIPADGAEACKTAWLYEDAPEKTPEAAPKK